MTLDRVEEVIENLNLVSGILDISETLDLFFKRTLRKRSGSVLYHES
jgi:hypothetical protein